jgi:hypothetical protein
MEIAAQGKQRLRGSGRSQMLVSHGMICIRLGHLLAAVLIRTAVYPDPFTPIQLRAAITRSPPCFSKSLSLLANCFQSCSRKLLMQFHQLLGQTIGRMSIVKMLLDEVAFLFDLHRCKIIHADCPSAKVAKLVSPNAHNDLRVMLPYTR